MKQDFPGIILLFLVIHLKHLVEHNVTQHHIIIKSCQNNSLDHLLAKSFSGHYFVCDDWFQNKKKITHLWSQESFSSKKILFETK
jgi:hypothetical protein